MNNREQAVKEIQAEVGTLGLTDEPVLVLDFGAQYSRLIARRVRECKVYSEIISYDTPIDQIIAKRPKALILSGGPASVYVENAPLCDARIFDLGIPVLGICYGQQIMAYLLGGEIDRTGVSEFGKTDIEIDTDSKLFSTWLRNESVWMSHQDSVVKVPPGFKNIASTSNSPIAAMENEAKRLFGIQFHPEVVHTPRGSDLIKNFLYDLCDCLPSWTSVSMIESATEAVKSQVGDQNIICGLSGGVDSAVAALLVHRAVGQRLTCVFVDHGFLRKDEALQVETTFRKHFKINLIHIQAQNRFLKRLKGVIDPEEKRKIIGEEFIRVFEEAAAEMQDVKFLVQGTLYPDVIESGTKDAARIKTHHNVGGIPLDMQFKLIEPLRLLFKDEVREIGEELGLSEEIVWRQPFPGPGLAVRIIGEITTQRLETLREAVDSVISISGPDQMNLRDSYVKTCLEEQHGIPVLANPLGSVKIAVDKIKTKAWLRENGFPTLPGAAAYSYKEAEKVAGDIGYPVAVKLAEHSGGVGFRIANSSTHLKRIIGNVRPVLIEKYMEGIEFSVEVLNYEKHHLALSPVYKGSTCFDGLHPMERVKLAPAPLEPFHTAFLRRLAGEIASRLDLQPTADIDIVWGEDGPFVLEINPRFGGVTALSMAASGVMVYWALVDMMLGRWHKDSYTFNRAFAADLPIGLNLSQDTVERLLSTNGIFRVKLQKLQKTTGRIALRADSLTQLLAAARTAARLCGADYAPYHELQQLIKGTPLRRPRGH